MRNRVFAAAIAIGAIAVGGVATASNGHSATIYKASLSAVNPAATTAGLADVSGRAQLVDGHRNKASLHVHNLAPNTTYLWHVHEGSCAARHVHEGSCAAPGAPVAGWVYRTSTGANGTLTSGASGNANTKGTSATFNADPAKSYSVNVHIAVATNGLPAGTIIACGDLTPSKAAGKSKQHQHPAQAKGPKAKS